MLAWAAPAAAQDGQGEGRSGAQVYEDACVSCHGPDGRGQPQAILGFEPPDSFPDFTDCPVATVESDDMWVAVIHRGGRIRGLSHIMPAFEDALTGDEIDRVVQFLHTFCAEPGWPRGNLNLPRPFFTEKAFPENETVFTVSMVPSHPGVFQTHAIYEKRLGRRAQWEIGGPFTMQDTGADGWRRGIGDITAGLKYALADSNERGSILSAIGEVKFPTGKETEGLGGGVTVFEAAALYGQILPGAAFLQAQAGFEWPADRDIEPNSSFWRAAAGRTFTPTRFGRTWTPMIEVLGSRPLVDGARVEWDLAPQLEISLSVFQHIRMNVGARVPVNDRQTRRAQALAYLLWDWGDGGLFEMWRPE
jgi:hypothetical protein